MKKCDALSWCKHMDGALAEEANVKRKGFSVLVAVRAADEHDEGRVVGVVYKKTSGDRGLMLNFCPWCGERILDLVSKSREGER